MMTDTTSFRCGSRVRLTDAAPLRQKYLKDPTESLQRESRQLGATSRLMQRSKMRQDSLLLLDHLVGAREQRRGQDQGECFCRLQVDQKLVTQAARSFPSTEADGLRVPLPLPVPSPSADDVMHTRSDCSFHPFQHIVREFRSNATLLILTRTGNGAKSSSMLAAAELSWRTQFCASAYLIDGSGIEKATANGGAMTPPESRLSLRQRAEARAG